MELSRRAVLAATAVGLAGCTGGSRPATPTGTATTPPARATYAYTHVRASGNRVLDGSGSVDSASPVTVSAEGTPAWLLAFAAEAGSHWTVVTTDGTATTHRVHDGTVEQVADHGTVPTPPLGYAGEEGVGVVTAPDDGATRTHPVPLDDGWLYVASNGDAVLWRGEETTRLSVDAPADTRIVAVGGDRYALYGAKTDRYQHGALGDTTEGGSLVVVDAASESVGTEVTLDGPVFEGLSPLAADLDGDGATELVTTVSDAADGARLRVYDTDGEAVATGPIYGSGWRHQLCVAPFAPDGTAELAVVRKPHVDRTLEFYRLDSDLTVTATHEGYASHTYGSRNLDGALAADFDDDGTTELLVPTTDRTTLDAVRRTDDGAETAWSLSLDGSLSTNVTGVALGDGRVAVGAGTADGVRVWQG